MFDWSIIALIDRVLLVLVDFIVRVLSVIFVPRNRRPQTATAWLLAIFFLPYIGIILFWLVGNRYLPKKRREKQREINRYILETTAGMDLVRRDKTWPTWLDPVVALNRNLGAMPMVGGNRATLHDDYDESLISMTNAIRTAKRYIHVEFYILNLDKTTRPFFDELAAAVERGVTVRVLLDHIACLRSTNYHETLRRLTEMGADWHLMLPVQPFKGKFQRPDLRNHRKILIIDGEVGYHRIPERHRLQLRQARQPEARPALEGPHGAVRGTDRRGHQRALRDRLVQRDRRTARARGRARADRPRQRTAGRPGRAERAGVRRGEQPAAVQLADLRRSERGRSSRRPTSCRTSRCCTRSPPPPQSGVDVQLFVSEIGDQAVTYHAQRSYYEELLRAGVRIWLYRAPTILHAKHITIDDQVAVIGSSNMDMRSFSLDLEISVMIKGSKFVQSLRRIEDSYRTRSRELTLDEWMRRPMRSKILDNVARLTAAVQ